VDLLENPLMKNPAKKMSEKQGLTPLLAVQKGCLSLLFAAYLRHRFPLFNLLEYPNNLLFASPLPLHLRVLLGSIAHDFCHYNW